MDEGDVQLLHAQLRAMQKQFRRAFPKIEGVSGSAVRVLGVVARGGDAGVQPRDIAGVLGMTSSNVAAALRELGSAGHVRRERDAQDRRQISVRLTERGAEAVAKNRAGRADWLRAAIEGALDQEEQDRLRELIPLLGRIAAYGAEREMSAEGA